MNLHLKFHERFPADKPLPFPALQRFKNILKLIPIVFKAIFGYVVYGPPLKEWTFSYHIIWYSIKSYLRQFSAAYPIDIVGSQQRNLVPSRVPKTTKITQNNCIRQQSVIEYFKYNVKSEGAEPAEENGDIYGEWLIPNGSNNQKVLLYFHGGAYVTGSAQLGRSLANKIAQAAGSIVYAINYRLAPQNPFPCGLIDAVSAYLYLINECEYLSSNIILFGDSAGGGLAIAACMAIRDMNLPIPAGVYGLSPWVDLTHSFETFDANGDFDYISTPLPDPRMPGRKHYYTEDEFCDTPLVSPWFQTAFHGLPKILIQTGTAERLFGENTGFAQKLAQNNVTVTLETFKSHIHVFQIFPFSKGSKVAINRAGKWIKDLFNGNLKSESIRYDFDFDGNFISDTFLNQAKNILVLE